MEDIGKYDPNKVEKEVLERWSKNSIYKKATSANKGKKKFYYLDGPPYTSGDIHQGHAWGKALRDSIMRYLRMKGLDVWDRPGFDMHGLPTANKVMAKHKLRFKEDIAKFGLDNFTEECKKFSTEKMDKMIKDFKRLGIWMDWDNPYIPLKKEFIEGNWWLIKKAHENGVLYEGKKSMAWCRECGTSLAKHELDYENVTDDSIFVKLKVEGRENEFLIIWTTTPWTIPFNMAVMVHPDFEYVKAKVGDETWIVAKGLAGPVIQAVANEKLEIMEEFKGKELEGTRYLHPFHEEIEYHQKLREKNKKAYSVVLSDEYVSLDAGTGLVHCAPGCGPEDFEVGHREGIPAFNNIGQYGAFPESMGILKGLVAKKDDEVFIKLLKQKGVLVAVNPVEHEYPHCWRCHKGVVWKTTKQWFFDVESKLKEMMIKENDKIKWVPDWAGSKWFNSWLRNLRDNGITRQITWGTPLPIWRCEDKECDKFKVIGSIAELEALAGKGNVPEDLHIPYIDEVEISCECGKAMKRIPDVLDVWIDAGTTSWTCLDYPQKKEKFEELWPADLILEGKDQIRGWFNLLLVASMVSMKKPSYKAVYMHGFINDAQGRKMSKSQGNVISPYEVIDEYGADTLRFYMIGAANPGLDLNYNFDDVKAKHRILHVLWNLHKFLIDLAETTGIDVTKAKLSDPGIEEQYMISRLNSSIKQMTFIYDNYLLNEAPQQCEELLLDLSRRYIQFIRDKAHFGSDQEKENVIYTVYQVLFQLLRLMAPVAPFITDSIYSNLNERLKLGEKASIHLTGWPDYDTELIFKDAEQKMELAEQIISSVNSARDKAGIGRRWPLRELIVVNSDDGMKEKLQDMKDIILSQTNIKDLKIESRINEVKTKVLGNFEALEKTFGNDAAMIIGQLAFNSPESIEKSIEQYGWFTLNQGGKSFQIKQDHLIITKNIPTYLEDASISGLDIYIDKSPDENLEAEGFAREISRRAQALRKKAGLQRTETIRLFMYCEAELQEKIRKFSDFISSRVGAEQVKILSAKDYGEHLQNDEATIKGRTFQIGIDLIS